MKKTFIRKIAYILAVMLFTCSLTGCGIVPSLSLTSEQNDLIAEYSAGLLLKYQNGHGYGLAPVSQTEEKSEEAVQEVQETASESAEEASFEVEPVVVESPEVDVVETQDSIYSTSSIDEAMGLNGFAAAYNTYSIQKIYPDDESDELVFSMQASPGSNLLVLHFNVTNINEYAAVCSTLSSNVKARVSVNGGDRIPAQATILMNDLFSLNEEIAAYGMIDAVAVFEIPEETGNSLSSLEFIIRGDNGESVYKLL